MTSATSLGFAPGQPDTSLPTFTACVQYVMVRLGCSQNKARRATREYLKHARHPSLAGLLEHAELVVPTHSPTRRGAVERIDNTGETGADNVDRVRPGWRERDELLARGRRLEAQRRGVSV